MDDEKIIPFAGHKVSGSWGNLYRVVFDLQPAPVFYQGHEVLYLMIWLYGDSPESAGAKARTIAQQLPYEPADLNPAVFDYPTPAADDSKLPGFNAQCAANEEIAKACGLAFMFCVEVTDLEH